ncbi:unnamed protein product [Darwinula stevensoni]|uniref:Ankyrin repeat and fibronectin type-III domain-containing protein 1 n=1 Tax=Darwinula stevensoni TaxID=69355 RepID=A0A7R8X0I2_9CRUS|nr:unnamed protein product [Darwinula stevensoni]CAG0881703.1 unnamed protein product [Darwinula stevensoni]
MVLTMAGKRVLTRSASDASSRLETQTSVPAPLLAMRKASAGPVPASRRDSLTPFRRKSSDVANLIASSVGVVVDGTVQRRSTRRSSIAMRKSASLRRKTSLPEQAMLLPFNRWKKDGLDLVDSLNMTKAEKRRLEKLNKISIHLHALFAAVEHSQVEKARTILSTTDVDVNSPNSDGVLALDIAVLTNNLPLVKILQNAGAMENPAFTNGEKCREALERLLSEAGRRVEDLTTVVLTQGSPSSPLQRQLILWRRRQRLLNAMKLGFDRLRPPEALPSVKIEVTSSDSVALRFAEPENQNLAVCTKVKAQWSCTGDFSLLNGEKEVVDMRNHVVHITGLSPGTRYFFRAAGGNVKGYGHFSHSIPESAVPSVWRDVDGRKPRFEGRQAVFEELFQQLRNSRSMYASSEIKADAPTSESQSTKARNPKKSTFKQLFTAAPKFQKEKFLKGGLYLGCVFYNEDRILVTNEEQVPVIEVEESYPTTNLPAEFGWLTKVGCTWEDVKSLRQDLTRASNSSSSSLDFRAKLLNAIAHIQSALGRQDLGQFFYRHLKDSNGTVILSLVNEIQNPKAIQSLSLKWIPLSKLERKSIPAKNNMGGIGLEREDSSDGWDPASVAELLLSSLQEQIQFHARSQEVLGPGLYLGYVKAQSSMDSLSILVPEKVPNTLPFWKIRDNPHVSSEEWESISHMDKGLEDLEEETAREEHGSSRSYSHSHSHSHSPSPSTSPKHRDSSFPKQICFAARKLFHYLDIRDEEAILHRIYAKEVVEVSSGVSFILVLPPSESVCLAPGQSSSMTFHPDLIPIPVPVFEMLHLRTYQKDLICRYARLSSILELDSLLAHLANREAFSSEEVSLAKLRLSSLQEIQSRVENTWKGARWLMDALSYAREKTSQGSIQVSQLLSTLGTIPNSLASSTSSLNAIRSPDILARQVVGEVRQKLTKCSTDVRLSIHRKIGLAMGEGYQGYHDYQDHSQAPHRASTSGCLLRVTKPDSSSDSLTSSSESVFNRNNPDLLSAHYPDWRHSAGAETIAGPEGKLNQSRSENSLSVHDDSEEASEMRKAALRKCSAPDCSGPGRESMLHVPSSVEGKRKKHSLDYSVQRVSENSSSAGSSRTGSLHSLEDGRDGVEDREESGGPSVIQVYAAYKTGLASGTSVKLHVTPRTTAREVVDLVVQQLNMAVIMKGKGGPVYSGEQLREFCLAAVIGARERCLRDDFRPLDLQNPWRKGRLFVRRKGDLLAALHQGQNQLSSYL